MNLQYGQWVGLRPTAIATSPKGKKKIAMIHCQAAYPPRRTTISHFGQESMGMRSVPLKSNRPARNKTNCSAGPSRRFKQDGNGAKRCDQRGGGLRHGGERQAAGTNHRRPEAGEGAVSEIDLI